MASRRWMPFSFLMFPQLSPCCPFSCMGNNPPNITSPRICIFSSRPDLKNSELPVVRLRAKETDKIWQNQSGKLSPWWDIFSPCVVALADPAQMWKREVYLTWRSRSSVFADILLAPRWEVDGHILFGAHWNIVTLLIDQHQSSSEANKYAHFPSQAECGESARWAIASRNCCLLNERSITNGISRSESRGSDTHRRRGMGEPARAPDRIRYGHLPYNEPFISYDLQPYIGLLPFPVTVH